MSSTRNRKTWTVNECIQLQREFELLEWSIDEIAKKHKRTPNAIMFKLDKEGFANYNTLYSEYHNLDLNKMCVEEISNQNNDCNKEYDYAELKKHIKRLENQILSLSKLVMMQNNNSKSVLSLFD